MSERFYEDCLYGNRSSISVCTQHCGTKNGDIQWSSQYERNRGRQLAGEVRVPNAVRAVPGGTRAYGAICTPRFDVRVPQ